MSVKRPTGIKWRQNAFARLVDRDGASCISCGAADRIVWRNVGYGSGELWGQDPWESYRFSRVHPCSVLEVEHIIPLSEGGLNEDSNLQLMCGPCHKVKTSAERSARLKRLFAEARS